MTPTSALVVFILLTAAASLHVPGCLPDEDATIVSESIFQVPDPTTGETFTNLTLTYFTCPSRQAQGQSEEPEESRALKRQSQAPIDLCGIMDSSAVFSSTFTQGAKTTACPFDMPPRHVPGHVPGHVARQLGTNYHGGRNGLNRLIWARAAPN
ncbi:hypothetical protein B0H17DRAFT_1152239 [Mycena rosella]|uniref:Uncharacterized protein n=1 Tax=Mycena rosella TaxID=1033263 RepID=A0AAD7FGM9_MYCRO|nr:hypothetical protein B0H17DRAFT_1152239 [Mycena rosella]